jgi:hypothetical protein
VWLKSRTLKRNWRVAPARCVDRELQKTRASRLCGGWTWIWRIVCEYEHMGAAYRVTPEVYWSSLSSEEAAQRLLAKRIAPDGGCRLRFDPANPLRTELLA